MKVRKDLEGSVDEIIEFFLLNLPEKTKKNREESVRIANVTAKIPNEHLSVRVLLLLLLVGPIVGLVAYCTNPR